MSRLTGRRAARSIRADFDMASAKSCHACGKSGAELLRCGRFRNTWFCNRACQFVARKELGHTGANCRDADQRSAAPSQPSTPMDVAVLSAALSEPSTPMDVAVLVRYYDLIDEGQEARMANTRLGYLVAVEKLKEAGSVADLIGGAEGALHRADADIGLSNTLSRLGNVAPAARAARSSLRAAREWGSRTMLVGALSICGTMAENAPSEMVPAERESREQERRSGCPSCDGLDLSQEGWVSLPTTSAALPRLCITYFEAAVATCDTALAAAGGRGSLAAANMRCVPSPKEEARARGCLGASLFALGEEHQRCLELI